MPSNQLSRKDFIRNSSLLLASSSMFPGRSFIQAKDERQKERSTYTLKNVRLETGFIYDDDNNITATKTALFSLKIEDGKIAAIHENRNIPGAIDAKGYLMLPAFKDMHIHLDKTFYGGPWRAKSPKNRSVKDMIAFEQQNLPEMLKTSTEKAERIIELLQSKGSYFARSHVNIEPTSKLQSLKNLQEALENKKNSFGAELVAFPQHGIYYTESAPIMKDAAQMGIDYIGGLDPNAIDGSVEKSLDFIVQLAVDYNKGIDIHLHEGGQGGLRAVEYLIEKVLENPVLKDKTYLSHCFVLANLEKTQQEAIAEQLAAAGIGIVSTIPFGRTIMPIPTLYKHGVKVSTGNDSIIDHWNTFGTGSVLQKANLMAQLYGYSSELNLSRALRIATGDILPLDQNGQQQWPKVHDAANVVLLDASCSAEAVARVPGIKSLIHQGRVIY